MLKNGGFSVRNVLTLVVMALGLSACAFTPHDVAVTAKAPTEQSTVGAGTNLFLEVIDDRESTVVGQRGVGLQGADITSNQIMSVLEQEIAAGFKAHGFNVVDSAGASDVEVEARLRAFKFFIESGFFSGAENTSVAIGVEGKRGTDDYDRVYRSSSEDTALVVPAAASIDEKLNASLQNVLSQMFADKKLMEFLTTP